MTCFTSCEGWCNAGVCVCVCVCHLKPLSLTLSHTHTHTHTQTLSFVCFSDGIGVSPVDLPASDGPDRLSGCVCDVLLHT